MRHVTILVFVIASVLLGLGCEMTGDPCVRYRGTVSVPAGVTLSGTGTLHITFGEGDGAGLTDPGDSVNVFFWDGSSYDVAPGDFPFSFDFEDMGGALTGGGIAVLDLDGDGEFSTGDRYSAVVPVAESEFGGCTNGCTNCRQSLAFVLDQVVP